MHEKLCLYYKIGLICQQAQVCSRLGAPCSHGSLSPSG